MLTGCESSFLSSSDMPRNGSSSLPLRVKIGAVSLARRVVARGGFDLVKLDPEHVPELRRPFLLRERSIDLLVDVGANDGTFSRRARAAGLLGPDRRIRTRGRPFLHACDGGGAGPSHGCVAVGARVGFGRGGAEDRGQYVEQLSFRNRAAPFARSARVRATSVRRASPPLDSTMFSWGSSTIILASTSRSTCRERELDVLAGAENVLRLAEVVDCELSLVPLYVGGAIWTDVVEHLAARGFGLLWVEPVLRDPTTNELLQMDGLFVRTEA